MCKFIISAATSLFLALFTAHLFAQECPLDLRLTGTPDGVLERLKTLSSDAQWRPKQKPLSGDCDYTVSSLMQFSAAPQGMCSIAGEPVIGSAIEIVDQKSSVVGLSYVVPKSKDTLKALTAALSRFASPLLRGNFPKAVEARSHYWSTDAVFSQNDELWIISHPRWEPGEVHAEPDVYTLLHVRRPWLEFALRDVNKCAALPAGR